MPSRPLVVLSREPADNAPLRRLLEERGAEVREIPCVSTVWLVPEEPLAEVDAVLFGSRRGVQGLLRLPQGQAWLSTKLIGTVGPRTTAEVRTNGLDVEWEADPPTGEQLATMLPPGLRLASVRGAVQGGSLEPSLTRLGHAFTSVIVYDNPAPQLPHLEPFQAHAVFAASPSAARRLLGACPWLASAPFVVLGPTTEKALQSLGVSDITTTPPSLNAQAATLYNLASQTPGPPIHNAAGGFIPPASQRAEGVNPSATRGRGGSHPPPPHKPKA